MKRHFASITTAAIMLLVVSAGGFSAEYAFITTTDYTSGAGSVIWLEPGYPVDAGAVPIHSDAVSRWYGGMVYVINRGGADNIQILDPRDGFSTVAQHSTGNGTNPQDIEFFSPDKAFVSLYETNELLIMNPETGAHLGTIDLSVFADADGLCEMNYMLLKNGFLFVAIQRLDRDNWHSPVGDSYIAVIDAAADSLIDVDPLTPGRQGIPLAAANPFTELKFDAAGANILVSCVGYWGVEDGGVEIIDPFVLESGGFMITESAAGGDINEFEIFSDSKGYIIVATPSFTTSLITFDPSSGTAGPTLYDPADWVLNDIEISPGGELFLADQTATDPGVWIWDTAADTLLTPSPRGTGLPPFQITFSVPAHSAAELPPALALGASYPNPFNPSTTIPFSLEKAGRVDLSVYDAAGRLVRVLESGHFNAGRHETVWNGISRSGLAAASGIYFVRMRAAGRAVTGKVVLLR